MYSVHWAADDGWAQESVVESSLGDVSTILQHVVHGVEHLENAHVGKGALCVALVKRSLLLDMLHTQGVLVALFNVGRVASLARCLRWYLRLCNKMDGHTHKRQRRQFAVCNLHEIALYDVMNAIDYLRGAYVHKPRAIVVDRLLFIGGGRRNVFRFHGL